MSRSSSSSTPKRPSSASSIAAAAVAKKQAEAVQTSIAFVHRDPYPVGLKILLPETIYPSPSEVRSIFVIYLKFLFFSRSSNILPFLSFTFCQVPERARGYLFEYELLEVTRTGAVVQYTNRIYKPMGTSFETFKETDEAQSMTYPLADLDDSHELWQQALGRTNAFLFKERQALIAATTAGPVAPNSHPSVDVSDIDTFFQSEGKGPKLLEFEFEAVTPEPVSYVDRNGRPSFYWYWTHRTTGHPVKRFSSASGKSFDTGRLTKYLKTLKENTHPSAFARAQHILLLNDSIREQIKDVPLTLDRRTLLGQQVCR
jgi:hypothetical protein